MLCHVSNMFMVTDGKNYTGSKKGIDDRYHERKNSLYYIQLVILTN